MLWRVDVAVPCLLLVVVLVSASVVDEQAYDTLEDEIPSYTDTLALLRAGGFIPNEHIYAKRDMDGSMPGVLRFGKRSLFDKREGVQKKEVPGVLRFGKRAFEDYEKSEPGVFRYDKRDMPGVLRFGKREMPGVLRFGKREEMPGVLRFGKRSVPGVLRFGKRAVPGVLRFGKREDIPGVLRFGKRSLNSDDVPGVLLGKKSVPGVLRFGK